MKSPVCDIYNDIAQWFDGARNKQLVEKECLDLILNKLPSRASILDLGCGTGEPIARYLIAAEHHITGIDGAENMIALCKQRFPDHDWSVQDMRTFDRAQTFDAIIAWDSFFHLSCNDQRAMFPLFAKLSKPNGLLLFSSGSEESEFWNPMLGHETVEMFHASLNSEEYERLLNQHGFHILRHQQSDPQCGGRTYWLSQFRI